MALSSHVVLEFFPRHIPGQVANVHGAAVVLIVVIVLIVLNVLTVIEINVLILIIDWKFCCFLVLIFCFTDYLRISLFN